MGRQKQIGIDVEVYRLIEQHRRSFSESHNDILGRILPSLPSLASAALPSPPLTPYADQSPFESQSPSADQSPFESQSPSANQSPFESQSPSADQSPFESQSLSADRSPFESQSLSADRSPFESRSLSGNRLPSADQSPSDSRPRSESQARSDARALSGSSRASGDNEAAPAAPGARSRGQFTVEIQGRRIAAGSLKAAYRALLVALSERAPDFLALFAREKGRSRRFVARTPAGLYGASPHLAKKHAEPLGDGWFFDTNLSATQVSARARIAARLCGLHYGTEVKLLENLREI